MDSSLQSTSSSLVTRLFLFQAPSAQVPDQSHPEKYMNFDTEWLDMVVHNNLWYKNTKAFKHHHHGEKKKVIPHLHPGRV